MNPDPLRDPQTDADPSGIQWMFMQEADLYRELRRREAQRRRAAMWLMLLAFSGILCIAIAAWVFR